MFGRGHLQVGFYHLDAVREHSRHGRSSDLPAIRMGERVVTYTTGGMDHVLLLLKRKVGL
jgi:hypothetical protein